MSFFQRHIFSNFNVFNEFTQNWDLNFRQLDRGRFKGTLLQYGIDDSQIGVAHFNRKFDQRGMPPTKMLTFAILEQTSPPIFWRGYEIDHNKIMVYESGDEIDCKSDPGFHVVTYSASATLIDALSKDLEISQLKKNLKRQKVIPISNFTRKKLLNIIGRTHLYVGREGNGLETQFVRNLIKYEIPSTFLKSIAKAQDIKIKSPLTKLKKRTLQTIDKYISDFPQEPVTIRELSELTGASERTIQYLFRYKYDIPPKNYLKLVRLNGVHKALYKANYRTTKIADIANDWGFWHMGQFAADYRRYFKELPTDTLRSKV